MAEAIVIALLVVLNGLFALAELAIVNARPARLQLLEDAAQPGAATALRLARAPERLLSTVQVGITLVSIVTGVYSGDVLASGLAAALGRAGLHGPLVAPATYAVVVSAVTFATIVVGELIPKRLALRDPEGVACVVAAPIAAFARLVAPLVWLLDASTGAVFRLVRYDATPVSRAGDDDIRSSVAEATDAGAIDPAERRMIAGVMRLGDRPVGGIMTPRADVEWLDDESDDDAIRAAIGATKHAYLPVAHGSSETLLGVVATRDLLAAAHAGAPVDLRAHLLPATKLPDTAAALDALSALQTAETPIVLVYDEHGHFEGVVTPADVLSVITGLFRSDEADGPGASHRDDGTWVFAGSLPVDEMADRLGVDLPRDRGFDTVAGFMLSHLHRLPAVGERIRFEEWSFEATVVGPQRIEEIVAAPVRE